MQINQLKLTESLVQTISNFTKELEDIPTCNINEFNPNDTLVVMVDMVNGFCKFGALSSPFVKELIPKMSDFLDKCMQYNLPIMAYQDAHSSNHAQEFTHYPPHCVAGSKESEIVDELKRESLKVVPKNSTNGFLAHNPLESFPNTKNIIVIGCVTDICICDFSTTMSKYFQEKDINGQVFVVENLTDTFEVPNIHNREAEHILALYHMQKSGVKFLKV